jgi:plastocyanin
MTTVQFSLPARRRAACGVIAALASAALLAGCGSSNSSSSTATPGPAASPTAGSTPATTSSAKAKALVAKTKAKQKASAAVSTASGKAKVVHTTTLKLSADPKGKLMFDPTKLTAKAGRVTLIMTDPSTSGVPHGVSLKGNGVDVDGAPTTPGGTSTVTATLQPGTYEYYCPVPGHAAAGMTGTLTIT